MSVVVRLIEGNIKRTKRALSRVARETDKARQAAINRTLSWSRTRAERIIASDAKVQKKVAARRVRASKARRGRRDAVLFIGYNPIGLSNLRPRQTRRGVTAGKHRRPGAFIAPVRGGRIEVFKRLGAARYPLIRQEIKISGTARSSIARLLKVDSRPIFIKEFEHDRIRRIRRLGL